MDKIQTGKTDDSLTSFSGEVAILGSVSFSREGIDFSKIEEELRAFIRDHRSDSDQWQEAKPSPEEESADMVWKMVHKDNKQDHATIRKVLNKEKK